MLKSHTPENIWNTTIKISDLWMNKVEWVVDDTLTKFFWIVWTNTKKRYAFSKAMRIFSNNIRSIEYNSKWERIKGEEIIKKSQIKDLISKKMKNKWLSIEPFLEYYLEKYSQKNIWLPPAEIDCAHKVDFIISSWDTSFWLDIKVWRNGSNKRKKTLEHAKNIDNPNYTPKTIKKERNRKEFQESALNTNNFSNNFLYHTNWILRINWNSNITKQLDNKLIFQNAYQNFINNNWEKNIEEYLDSSIDQELRFISKSIPKALAYLINFLKHWKLKRQRLKLPENSWKVIIYMSPNLDYVEVKLYEWKKTNSYCDLFIPITEKLKKNIL